jgi:hypothetical protein
MVPSQPLCCTHSGPAAASSLHCGPGAARLDSLFAPGSWDSVAQELAKSSATGIHQARRAIRVHSARTICHF